MSEEFNCSIYQVEELFLCQRYAVYVVLILTEFSLAINFESPAQ